MASMGRIVRRRGWVKGTITRAYEACKELGECPLDILTNRLTKLEEAYTEYNDLSKQLYDYKEVDGFVDPMLDVEEYENKYLEGHAILSAAINELSPSPEAGSEDSERLKRLTIEQNTMHERLNNYADSSVRLTKIKIPAFSGNYEDWPAFKDLFVSTVVNQRSLDDVQRFHYLNSCLTGNALRLVKHLNITSENYHEAWSRLEKRYEKRQLIIKSHIQNFMSLPSTHTENTVTLRQISDGADSVIRGLHALNANDRDPWLIYLLLSKVDEETKRLWSDKGNGKDDRTFESFLEFLDHRCETLESTAPSRSPRKAVISNYAKPTSTNSHITLRCAQCQQTHTLSQCPDFRNLNVSGRRAKIKTWKLCFNCLSSSHQVSKCNSTFRCKICQGMHHTLVHLENSSSNRPTDKCLPSSHDDISIPAVVTNHSVHSQHTVATTLLPTVIATVIDKFGNKGNCRALLDSGSTVSFVTESFAQRIGLRRRNARVPVLGLSACRAGVSRGLVTLNLMSNTSDQIMNIDALVLPTLSSSIPTQAVDLSAAWSQITSLSLADPSFCEPGQIDVLIGSDYIGNIYTGERRSLPPTRAVAMHTTFGWVILGSGAAIDEAKPPVVTHHAFVNIDHAVRMFMDMESIEPQTAVTQPNDPVEAHFTSTHTRDDTGSYVVQYPFKENTDPIADTFQQTVVRLHSMERRFRRNVDLKNQYTTFMKEYQNLGHMERTPRDEVNKESSHCFYLAHHAVFKPDSTTTKIRVVFDGSCKDASGISLNERLHIGPPIQRDLLGVALRFRQHKYVFTADIEKMFRGIKVAQGHQDFQRIIWREDDMSPIVHFRLLTVTYGLSPSPYLAVRLLKQLALDYVEQYPIASCVLMEDAYVDDILTGSDSVNEVVDLKNNLIALLAKGNFKLRKWSSNCWPLLNSIPKEDCEFHPISIDSSEESFVKILGLQWNPCSDALCLKVTNGHSTTPTKRVVLSETSKIYDPLGIVAPCIILFKVLFQETWFHGLEWDDALPIELSDRWDQYIRELPELARVRVPRDITWYEKTIELHGFADASSVACAAVIYSRFKIGSKYHTRLIAAKTRVAPLKPITIPRLELNAAVLLTRLLSRVTSSLSVKISKIYCWTDSEIVLHWLSAPPRKWQTFVCNRTAEILCVAERTLWHHVRSEENPADCASRGLTPSKLIKYELWWAGPKWSTQHDTDWPTSNFNPVNTSDEVLMEPRKQYQTLLTAVGEYALHQLIDKCSSWTRLVRVLAYCSRFMTGMLGKCTRTNLYLSTTELLNAKYVVIRHVQQHEFPKDVVDLQRLKTLSSRSKLLRYAPFLDKVGIMRVGGRLRQSNLNFNTKHPILLPKDTHISLLIARYIHENNLHTGVEATHTLLRQQFWILGSRNLVRKVIFRCKRCFMLRNSTCTQIMGDLPSVRLQANRCFLHCGLDYAGPVSLKSSRGRNPKINKAWFSIFVCLSTKAIHLELVSDLTAESFIAAFRRFISRRGKPTDLYSDNGTTFHGSKRILNELYSSALSQTNILKISELLANDGVSWHFIPPSAPHFGGLWEAGVKSVKLHLRRVIGSAILTFEEYYTILAQIEALLNSRPLCAISDEDIDALTPAHFLIGEPYTCIPEPSLLDTNPNRLQTWRHLQTMVQGFWKRWHTEYLTSLQHRAKWQQARPNLKEGDVVVLKEPNLPPCKWVLGRITEATYGTDGKVRVVKVKSGRGEYVRPIHKVALLPLS